MTIKMVFIKLHYLFLYIVFIKHIMNYEQFGGFYVRKASWIYQGVDSKPED